jgi:hypothetical protein
MFLIILLCITVLGVLYIYHVNHAMCDVPEDARNLSPHRWTINEIKAAYKKAVHNPIDVTESLPARQNRRYIVVGGSGALLI